MLNILIQLSRLATDFGRKSCGLSTQNDISLRHENELKRIKRTFFRGKNTIFVELRKHIVSKKTFTYRGAGTNSGQGTFLKKGTSYF